MSRGTDCRGTTSMIMLITFVFLVLPLSSNMWAPDCKSATIIVPDEYAKIQDAINAASTGDTIFVRNGTYYENVVVNKPIALVGENENSTVVDGSGMTAVSIFASDVVISGFTIRGGNGSFQNGIYVNGQCHCIVAYNNIVGNSWGICLEYDANNNSIFGNYIVANSGAGILLEFCSGNSIFDNNITGNTVRGILLMPGAFYNYISGNDISFNMYGIVMDRARYNSISGNNILNNLEGIRLESSDGNRFSANNISGSAVGMTLDLSDGNSMYHNNFADNQRYTAINEALNNSWDGGYPTGGNCWSGYNVSDIYSGPYQNETGSDGIGDAPYILDADNIDRYPLMNPYATIPGDVDYSGIVNMLDLYYIASHYGANRGELNYAANCDIDDNGIINMLDLYIAAIHFGQTEP